MFAVQRRPCRRRMAVAARGRKKPRMPNPPPRRPGDSMRLLSLTLALALLAEPAARAEAVRFAGKGLELSGTLVRPAGPGPFPAIVALHGCSGLYGRTGELSARHEDWARRL